SQTLPTTDSADRAPSALEPCPSTAAKSTSSSTPTPWSAATTQGSQPSTRAGPFLTKMDSNCCAAPSLTKHSTSSCTNAGPASTTTSPDESKARHARTCSMSPG